MLNAQEHTLDQHVDFAHIAAMADEAADEVMQADMVVPLAFTNRYLDGADLSLVMASVTA